MRVFYKIYKESSSTVLQIPKIAKARAPMWKIIGEEVYSNKNLHLKGLIANFMKFVVRPNLW